MESHDRSGNVHKSGSMGASQHMHEATAPRGPIWLPVPPGNSVIRILIAEDMNMVRGALVALLNLQEDLDVVCEVQRGDEIVDMALKHRPDVALIDIDLPGVDGLSAAVRLREKLPQCRVLILTSLGRPGALRRALEARVAGYLRKDAPSSELATAVRRVAAGHRAVDPELALAAWEEYESPLTDRETQVLRLAAEGAEPREIAAKLRLSAGTVRNYLTTIIAKLNARNRVDAIRIARDSDWLL